MKRLPVILLFLAGINASGQKQTFDIVTYTPPKEWKKESTENAIQFTKQDDTRETYCIITLMKSIPGTANAKENFDAAWKTVVKEMVKVSAAPEMQPSSKEDGWEAQSGYAPFESDGTNGVALLITSTGYQKMVNILILTNTRDYEKEMTSFLESINLKKPDINNSNANTPSIPSSLTKNTWKSTQNRKDAMGQYAGYSSNVYQFNSNGTYQFQNTSFQMSAPKYSIVDEEGTYEVNGNKITLKPAKNKYHVHQREKTDPASKSGSLALENIQYSFEHTVIYNRRRLILSPRNESETKRDGKFNYYADGKMQKAYLYDASSEILAQTSDIENKSSAPPATGGFAYNTTNFDNGWVSTVYDDYVLTSKGSIKVYLSYIEKFNESDFAGIGREKRHYYWDSFVSKYLTTGEMRYNPGGALSDYSSDYIEGWATDKQTKEKRYIGMILNIVAFTGRLSVIIASAPDEQQFRKQFPKADTKFDNDLLPMYGYNKFAVAKNDLIGTWSSGGGGTMSWYSATTGEYAGATGAATSDVFNFNADGSYTSEHKGGYGVVGAMNTYQQKYKGAYTVTDWNVTATKRWDGKTVKFDAWFEIVNGGRLLHLTEGATETKLFKEK